MDIGVLGSGMVGETLGSGLVKLGHTVMMGTRSPAKPEAVDWAGAHGMHARYGTFADAAAFGEIVFNCTNGEKSLAAPADSRLTVAPRPCPDTTQPGRSRLTYMFLSPSLAFSLFVRIRFHLRYLIRSHEEVRPMAPPCSTNPELWFGYPDADGTDGAAKARAYEQSATEARLLCLRRCPLAQQRRCAALAVERNEEYGVWAGVKLPGGQYRKRAELAQAHAVLRAIAAGEINSRELADNQALLTNHESRRLPVTAAVFHLPADRIGSPSAA